MAQFTINNTNYTSKPLDAFVQLRIMKRLARVAPALAKIAPALKAAAEGGSDVLADIDFGPLFTAFADLPDQDFDFIINACCAVTTRKTAKGVGWMPVMQPGHGGPVFMDMNDEQPTVLLLIAWNVLRQHFDQFLGVAKTVKADL